MKIGLIRRGYSSTGGAEAYLLRLAAELARAGHELVLFSSVHWPDEAFAAHDLQMTRVVLKVSGVRAFADAVREELKRRPCDRVFSLERVWQCDVYRAGDGVHAAWLQYRAQDEPRWKPLLRRINPKHTQLLQLERALFTGGAKRIIANSTMVKREIVNHFKMRPEKIAVIHNGLPPFVAPPGARETCRKELALVEEDYVLLFAGTGWERKGLRFALQAMEALSAAASLLVAGRGKHANLPHSRRTRFLGPRADLPTLLAAADAFILPTIYDPFSNACLEALAAGLPVITTKRNGFEEIIEPGKEGEVVADPRDIGALARAIEAWRDPVRRAEARPKLAALGSKYSIAENVRKTLEIIGS